MFSNLYDGFNVNWDQVETDPLIRPLKGIQQNSKWHREGDVYTHTCLVTQAMLDKFSLNDSIVLSSSIENPQYRSLLIHAALYHDLGKQVTSVLGEDGLWHAPDHAFESRKLLPSESSYALGQLVALHMDVLNLNNEKDIKNIINQLKGATFEQLLFLKECDILGSQYDEDQQQKDLKKLKELKTLFYNCVYAPGIEVKIVYIGEYHNKKLQKDPKDVMQGVLKSVITTDAPIEFIDKTFEEKVTKIINKNTFLVGHKLYKIYETNK